jgi:hypothetical protein
MSSNLKKEEFEGSPLKNPLSTTDHRPDNTLQTVSKGAISDRVANHAIICAIWIP